VTGVATSPRRLRIALVAALALTVAVVVAGWAAKSGLAGARHVTTSVTVKTRKVPKLGTVLVNSKGLTLYMFVRDNRKKVTCTSTACVIVWPPLKLKSRQKATAGGAARKGLLGSDKNPKGGRVVTYNRWPLYTYYLDKKPGQVKGQAVNNSGGLWYVLSPAGKVIRTKP
jgi:predicted lipoprotein with Yx(FWY)xxD motif